MTNVCMTTACVMFAVSSLLACGKHTEPQPTVRSAASEEARSMFKTVCAACHGENGRGDGVAAASLNPKPRDYTDKAWQRSVTDDHIRDIILKGGSALGKSPLMPAQPQLAAKPDVVEELVKIVRSFGS
jgi:mono/diheme cytochrome c family protein